MQSSSLLFTKLFRLSRARWLWAVVLCFFVLAVPTSLVAAIDVEDDRFEELLYGAVVLMVDNHPSLISQRSLVATSRSVSMPDQPFPVSLSVSSGIGSEVEDGEFRIVPALGVTVSSPLVSPDRTLDRIKTELSWARVLEGDVQNLQESTERLTSKLLAEIGELVRIRHQLFGRHELMDLLRNRRAQQERLVQSGVAEPSSIWALDERITELRVELADLEARSVILVNETAYNFAGEAWMDLKGLLEEIVGLVVMR